MRSQPTKRAKLDGALGFSSESLLASEASLPWGEARQKRVIPQISVRQLQYFAAVYEEGSFSRAAERENCSQPALSAQVRLLEGVLGSMLFERSASGVVPTFAGRQFYQHAVSILRSLYVAERDISAIAGHVSGDVCAGLIPSVVRGLLPTFLPPFVQAYPHINLQLVEGFSGTLLNWLLAQEIDFAVVVEPPQHEALEITSLGGGPAVLIAGNQGPVPSGHPVRLQDLPPLNLVLPTPRHGLRSSIERSIWTKDIKVARSMQMDSVCGMIEFVKRSDWVTILPTVAIICDIDSDDLVINPIVDPPLQGQLYLVHLKKVPLGQSATLFVDALQREVDRARSFWESVPDPA